MPLGLARQIHPCQLHKTRHCRTLPAQPWSQACYNTVPRAVTTSAALVSQYAARRREGCPHHITARHVTARQRHHPSREQVRPDQAGSAVRQRCMHAGQMGSKAIKAVRRRQRYQPIAGDARHKAHTIGRPTVSSRQQGTARAARRQRGVLLSTCTRCNAGQCREQAGVSSRSEGRGGGVDGWIGSQRARFVRGAWQSMSVEGSSVWQHADTGPAGNNLSAMTSFTGQQRHERHGNRNREGGSTGGRMR